MNNTHAVPLTAPSRQAEQLIELALEHHPKRADAIAFVRELIAEEVAHRDDRMCRVVGYPDEMTGTSYHALVLAAIDRIATTGRACGHAVTYYTETGCAMCEAVGPRVP